MIHCKKCEQEIDLRSALLASPFSWPQLQTIWHVCKNCNTGNHLRFVSGGVQLIDIIGAPGPEWEILQAEIAPDIDIRVDPSWLHIWLGKTHYEIPART